MRRFLVFLFAMFMGVASASTVNIDWDVDGSTYAQTTCEIGGNLTLPAQTPTKYGYTFKGWKYDVVYGTVSQSGTPSPSNPIEPTFRQFGNTVLRAVGSGNNLVADYYDPVTNKIKRRVGVLVLDGTSKRVTNPYNYYNRLTFFISDFSSSAFTSFLGFKSTHFETANAIDWGQARPGQIVCQGSQNPAGLALTLDISDERNTADLFNQWLADQYANGTPVTIYYPRATPIEETFVQ